MPRISGTGLVLLLLFGTYAKWFSPVMTLIILFVIWLLSTVVEMGNKQNERMTAERISQLDKDMMEIMKHDRS